MAVTKDNSADWSAAASFSQTYSNTVTSDNCLVVIELARQNTLGTPTYNGVTMSVADTFENEGNRIGIYYLIGAASGNNTLAISMSNNNGRVIAVSINGVDQSSPVVQSLSQTYTGTSSSLSPTFTDGDIIIDGIFCNSSFARTLTADSDQTELYNVGSNTNSHASSYDIFSSTVSWTLSGASNFGGLHLATSFSQATASASTNFFSMF